MSILKWACFAILMLSLNVFGQVDSIDTKSNVRVPKIYDFCDVEAEFPGGSENMRQFLINRLDHSTLRNISSAPYHTVYTQFIVSDQGYIHSIKVYCEDPILKRQIEYAISCMPRWIPGEIYQKAAATRIRLPITFITGDRTFHY